MEKGNLEEKKAKQECDAKPSPPKATLSQSFRKLWGQHMPHLKSSWSWGTKLECLYIFICISHYLGVWHKVAVVGRFTEVVKHSEGCGWSTDIINDTFYLKIAIRRRNGFLLWNHHSATLRGILFTRTAKPCLAVTGCLFCIKQYCHWDFQAMSWSMKMCWWWYILQ